MKKQKKVKTAGRAAKKCPSTLQFQFVSMAESRLSRRMTMKLGLPVEVKFTDNSSVMISYTRKGGRVMELRLHRMFRKADERIINSIAGYVRRRDRTCSVELNRFIKSHQHMVKKPRSRSVGRLMTSGLHHDLAVIFNRLNRDYFGGRLDASITWGRRNGKKPRRHIRLGSYSYENKLIRIHPSLDKSWVPAYFVESVVYHEMLHAWFEVSKRNGKAMYHTPAFRQMERLHPHFERARRWERDNIHRLLG